MASPPKAGDLLIAGQPGAWHQVGLFVGGDQLVDCWYTGACVRRHSYVTGDWQLVLRVQDP